MIHLKTNKYRLKPIILYDELGFKTPVFSVGDDTASVFINALLRDDPLTVVNCLSKASIGRIDLLAVRLALLSGQRYSMPIAYDFDAAPKNTKTDSIMLIENKRTSVLRFSMVSEDGKWKIFKVESE
jgi:hypothetical protein